MNERTEEVFFKRKLIKDLPQNASDIKSPPYGSSSEN